MSITLQLLELFNEVNFLPISFLTFNLLKLMLCTYNFQLTFCFIELTLYILIPARAATISSNIHDMSNYRHISILPVLLKLLEKIIYKRLADFFTVNNVLNEAHFGFRESHLTIQAVQTAVNSIVNTMNTSSYCMGIFIDFS